MDRASLTKSLVALAFIATVVTGCQKKAEGGPQAGRGPGGPIPVNVGMVVSKDVPVELRTVGNVQPYATVSVKPQVGGELLKMHFEEGQEVKKGDLLFTIQPKLYTTQLAQAEANLARDRVQAANAQKELARAAELSRKGAVSREQLDTARAQAESLEATVKADEAAVEIAKVQVGYTTIEAPITGRTGTLRVNVGNVVTANGENALVTLNQIEPIYVQFSLPERYLPEIRKRSEKEGLQVVAIDPSTNNPLAEGALTFIENQVDPSTGMILLKGTFKNEDRMLWPGQFVDVTLRLATQEDAVVLPAAAVVNGQRGQQVFVVKPDKTAELRPVVVDRNLGQEIIVKEGVKPGEIVVTNGQLRIVPGGKVAVREGLLPESGPAPGGGAGANKTAALQPASQP